ncbi:MAG: stage II sporulation protein R [Bacilli bacterium]|nr:stage II sporulation protein R [Bacilli bacterium]
MKKIILLITILSIISISNDYKNKDIEIPNEAIRFRVIANSNTKEDQELKMKVKYNLEHELEKSLKNKKSIRDSRIAIKNNIPVFKRNIEKTLKNENSKESYTINYGLNYFPEKEYKKVKYKEGNYESLVVTLGTGEGENFWCVLFPPLCKLENENNEKVEYKILVKEILDKFK